MAASTPLRPYASAPARRNRQLVVDVLAVLLLVGLGWLALKVHTSLDQLATPGDRLASAGAGLQENLASAAEAAGGVPFAGDQLKAAIDQASQAAAEVEDAGRRQADGARTAADWVGWAVFVLPALSLLLVWLPRRWAYARRAGQTVRIAASVEGADLLALRALTTQPLRRLHTVSASPAEEWRRGDAGTIAMLARLELDSLGLR